MRVFVRDGIVWREEQAATFDTIEEGVPDFNPMGCQKGAAWSQLLYGPDRLLYPLKRVGERGEGRWNRQPPQIRPFRGPWLQSWLHCGAGGPEIMREEDTQTGPRQRVRT